MVLTVASLAIGLCQWLPFVADFTVVTLVALATIDWLYAISTLVTMVTMFIFVSMATIVYLGILLAF